MSSRCRSAIALALAAITAGAPLDARALSVCADPDDMPYSSVERTGFENRIAALIADELGVELDYRWQPLRRGVVRKTLDARACDMLAGVPVGVDGVATTSAYYRSAYAFVHRRDAPPIASFDDPRLRRAAIGVQLVGADMAATPAALALARRGIVENVMGFPVYGSQPSAQRMIDAIEAGRLDVAVVWGPQAGFFAQRARVPLAVTIAHDAAGTQPLAFDIAVAVRKDDIALRDAIDAALERARARVQAILVEFGVPQVEQSVIATGPSR